MEEKKVYPVFGLNTGKLVKFEYNPNGGKGGSPKDVIDIAFTIGSSEVRSRIFDFTPNWALDKRVKEEKTGNYKYVPVQPGEQGYNDLVTEGKNKQIELLLDILIAAGVDEALKDHYKKTFVKKKHQQTFKEIAVFLSDIFKNKKPDSLLDIFLQYQTKLQTGNDRVFLELPRDEKYGKIITKHREGVFTKKVDDHGIHFMNSDTGEIHPFKRNVWYSTTKYANSITPYEPKNKVQEVKNDNGVDLPF